MRAERASSREGREEGKSKGKVRNSQISQASPTCSPDERQAERDDEASGERETPTEETERNRKDCEFEPEIVQNEGRGPRREGTRRDRTDCNDHSQRREVGEHGSNVRKRRFAPRLRIARWHRSERSAVDSCSVRVLSAKTVR